MRWRLQVEKTPNCAILRFFHKNGTVLVGKLDFCDLGIIKNFHLTPTKQKSTYYLTAYKKGNSLVHIPLHRLVLRGKFSRKFRLCDHRNGDTLDNQRANLRAADHRQNRQNSPWVSKCGTPGIHLTTKNRYEARTSTRGRYVYLGTYDTLSEARTKIYEFNLVKYGSKSLINKPDGEHPCPAILSTQV